MREKDACNKKCVNYFSKRLMSKIVRTKDVRSLIPNEKTEVIFLRCVKRRVS